MCQVEIKNCNNINNAIINIEEGTLNIKFAINRIFSPLKKRKI